ncbi:MAG: PUR family DNA/RNA-binding protein [Prevotellaceae bacterium]|jgi:hypothetical protein|nr:PUR family DNA/RNA-binding protein [Prevotellaceae bacterium]
MDDFEKHNGERLENPFSKPVKAGKRTYFFDVKVTREGEQYLTITESKRQIDRGGKFFYEKHKIFLYQEDFENFLAGLNEALDYVADSNASAATFGFAPEDEARFSDVNFDELGEK